MLSLRRFPQALYATALAIASICIHAIPFILYSRNPLGYDTGFYRRYLIQPFLSFPNAPVPGVGDNAWGPRLFFDVLHAIHLPTDIALYGSYLLLQALLPVLVFLFLRRSMGTGSAFLAGAFIILSSIGYQAFWYMLYKNIFALDLMIMGFMLLERKRTLGVYAFDILIALSHATSAIIYMLTLAALVVFERERRREMAVHTVLTAIAFALVNVSTVREVSYVLPTALFIEWRQFLWLSLPFLILIMLNGRALWRPPLPRSFIAFTGVSLLYPILHLPFYERIFVYADIGLASLSAYAAYSLVISFSKEGPAGFRNMRAALVCIAVGLLLGNLYQQIYSLRPLISEASIARIETVGSAIPPNALILTSADEAPWYEGWTTAHIAAPGLLHDTHDLIAWNAFWSATSTEQQRTFLNSFTQPLYVSTLNSPDLLFGGLTVPCLKEISTILYISECDIAQENTGTALATEAHPIHAVGAGAYNLSTNTVWNWNADTTWPIASLTKLMTAVIADMLIPSTQYIQITPAAEAPLVANHAAQTFGVGDTLTRYDLIKAMLIASSNDAAEALATSYGYNNFIAKMNEEAQVLHMSHTVFVSASGLSAKNISTVDDLALLVKYIWTHEPQLLTLTRSASTSISVTNGGAVRQMRLININPLSGTSTFLGGKTGTLPEADQNLIATFETKKGPVLIIVLGADDRFGEAQSILSAF